MHSYEHNHKNPQIINTGRRKIFQLSPLRRCRLQRSSFLFPSPLVSGHLGEGLVQLLSDGLELVLLAHQLVLQPVNLRIGCFTCERISQFSVTFQRKIWSSNMTYECILRSNNFTVSKTFSERPWLLTFVVLSIHSFSTIRTASVQVLATQLLWSFLKAAATFSDIPDHEISLINT